MIQKNILKKAADKNIINQDQIDPLYQFIKETSINPDTKIHHVEKTSETFKFTRSFGDVFIVLGIFLLVASINMTSLSGYYYLLPAVGFIIIAEWLVRARRLVLPGMVILIAILYFINKAFIFEIEHATTASLGVIFISSLFFYLRYKMPFSLLPIAASLVAITIIQIGTDVLHSPIIFAAMGLIIFSIAMAFDSHDTKRQNHLSDSAFWLHLLAAPLIVHGAMITLLTSNQNVTTSVSNDLLMIIFFAGFFLLALFIDRRAMLVSTQLYAIYALTQLFKSNLISEQNIIIYVFMTLGFFVIFFGTYWYKTRCIIFATLSKSKLARFVPDLKTSDQ